MVVVIFRQHLVVNVPGENQTREAPSPHFSMGGLNAVYGTVTMVRNNDDGNIQALEVVVQQSMDGAIWDNVVGSATTIENRDVQDTTQFDTQTGLVGAPLARILVRLTTRQSNGGASGPAEVEVRISANTYGR